MPSSAPVVEALEPRMLLSADLGLGLDAPRHLTDPDGHESNTNDSALDALPMPVIDANEGDDATPQPLALDAIDALVGENNEARAEPRHEVVFVDAAVDDADTLLAALQERSDTTLNVIILDAERDGVAQIADTLSALDDVDAVHVLSHGNAHGVQLGSTWLDNDSLSAHARGIASWSEALGADADLLFYGCNLAEGADGRALLQDVARLTGADVGASVDATGASTLGGDWDLEYRIGSLEASLTVEAPDEWQHVLALIAEESFDYPAATGGLSGQTGGIGWGDAWENKGSNTSTVAASLDDPTGTLQTSGGAVQFTTSGGSFVEQSRNLSSALGADGTTVWASFLVQPDVVSGSDFAGLGFADVEVWAGYTSGEYKLTDRFGSEFLTGVAAVSGETALLVVKLEFAAGNDTVSLYINPTPGEASPDTPALAVKSDRDMGTFTQIDISGGYGFNDALLDEIRIGDTFADVVPAADIPGALWFSTADNVSAVSGAPGLDAWNEDELVKVSGTDFSLGPDAATDGDFTLEFDLGAFGSNKNINGMHYMQSSFTIGSGVDEFTFEKGDILLTVNGGSKYTYNGNTTSIDIYEEDVFVFRPQAAGDYSGGDFYNLLDNPLAGKKVRGISIVESPTGVTIGDGPALAQGTFLLSQDGGSDDQKVYTYLAQTVGDASTSSVLGKQVLIDGDDAGDLNFTDQVQGIHIIDADITIGDMSFVAGDLLLTLHQDALTSGGKGIGATSQDVYQHDVFRLRLSETVQGSGRSMGVADIVFDGSNVGLNTHQEDLDAIALVAGSTSIGAPAVADITTDEDTQSGLIIVDRHPSDGAEVTHFKVSGISHGTLFLADGVTPVNDGDFITVVQGQAGLRFLPSSNSTAIGSFDVESSEDGSTVAAQSGKATSTITVTPVGDTPVANDITTDEDTLSGLIVLDRNPEDGPEVTHLKITGITNGTLFLADGVTPVSDGDFITVAQGQAGLRFLPSSNSTASGSFDVESSEDGATVAAQSARATSTITVNPINDDPTNDGTLLASATVKEDVATDIDLSAIDLSDVDAAGGTMKLILSTGGGGVVLADSATVTITGSGTDYVEIEGTLAELNAFLDTPNAIRYLNDPGTDSDTISVAINDLGNTGTGGGGDVALGDVSLTVNPVNDAPVLSIPTTAFINELHYDNVGVDTGEAVEIAALAGTDLAGWNLVFYNGFTGAVYHTEALSGVVPDQADGFGTLAFTFPSNTIQNGDSAPDGIALVNADGEVLQFISYEGSFTAVDGPADGMRSTDIGVTEDGTTPVGHSLQLTGSGTDFTWASASPETLGALNTGQSFAAVSTAVRENVLEDGTLVFSAGTGNALTVTDDDAADGADADPLLITLSVNNGTLTLGDVSGLLNLVGDGTSSVSFEGSIAEIDAALDGLTYQPTSNFTGSDTLTIVANDQGNTGPGDPLTDKAQVAITVNPVGDTPVANDITTDEDTLSGLIVLDRNASDGAEVTHLKISGVTNGTLFLADGVTPVNDGDFITVAQGQAGLRFLPSPNSTAPGSFDVESSEDGATVAAQSAKATSTITVNPVGDTPVANDISTDEDTLSGLIVLDRNAGDGGEVTHLKISGLTNGTLFLADGVTPVSDGDFITVAQGQAGLRFLPSPNSTIPGSFDVEASEDGATVAAQSAKATSTITVNPVGDTPVANDITTDEDTLSGLIVLDRNASDGPEVTHLKITGITNGTLFLADGVTPVSDDDFITVAQGQAGLRFLPSPNSTIPGSFDVEASEDGATVAAQSTKATSTITVNPVGDTPVANDLTTDEDTLSGLIVLDRNAGDGPEVTHLKITGISNGTLFLADGVTPVSDGDFITVAQGQAGLRFLPASNSTIPGSFDVESSEDGATVAAQSAKATSTITVNPVGDTPVANDITTDEDTLSGLIVLDRNASDGTEVTHLKISGISNGTLFLADGVTPVSEGDFITVAQGNAGLRFMPTPGSSAAGSFDVESSEDGATVAAQSAKATSTVTVNAVGDTPVANDITTDEDTLSGLIVLDRNASDGPEVTHLKISGISNGTLFLADGVTPVSDGDFITVAQGQAGLRFMPSPNSTIPGSFDVESSEDGATVAAQSAMATSTITVSPVGDTPVANDITTDEDTLSGLIVLDRNAGDGPEITHLRISGITNGTLFLADGVTPVSDGDFITVAQGNAGLRFMPTPGSSAPGSFDVESSEDGSTVAAQSAKATSTITVNAVGDTPVANDITTDEDTQSGLIVLDRNASDGPEVTHLKISGISNGTLFLADGVTPVSEGDFITVAQGQAGLRFMPSPNSTISGSFDVESSEDGATVAAQSAKATSTITITPVGDTPVANDITTTEDTLSGLIVLDRNPSDGAEVTHLKITGITNGTLFLADGVTPVSNGDFITVAQGAAGLRFMPSPGSTLPGSFDVESSEDGATVAPQSAMATSTITVNPTGDTPTVADATTDEDTLSTVIVVDRHPSDGPEVTHFKVSGISNGTLFLADGVTPVSDGDFILVADGQAGLRFLPDPDSTAPGTFDAESSEDGVTVAAGSGKATSTITVTPVGDTPVANDITTDEDTLSGLIVLDRNAGDGAEVTHLKITGISNGTLFLADGVTAVSDGDFITVAQGAAGLRFMPTPGSSVTGSFDVESSEDGMTVAAQSAKATSTIIVTAVGDTPLANDVTTDEDTLSGLIVLDRNASDGPEVTHLKITGITNGTLFLADGVTAVSNGDFITVAQGQTGLRFMPSPGSSASGSFDVEASEDGTTVAAQSAKATSTITVNAVGDTPIANDITTDEDTMSGLIVLDRNASDGGEVTHLKISGITNGTLFLADGVTPVSNGDFITVAQGNAGLRFMPSPGSSATCSFDVEASEDGATVAAQSATATSTITVTPVGDTPVANDITTDEDTLSGLIVLDRNASDGAEVTHLKITSISNGSLFLADGVTSVNNGDFITVAQGQAGVRFTPAANSAVPGSFDVESSQDGVSVAAQSARATSTITVTPVGDTPVAASVTTSADTQSGLIVLDRHATDGGEVTHLRISGISNGSLFLADGVTPVGDGDFITVANGQAGLRFTPTPGSSAAGSFDVESSEDGATVAAQSAKATSTITVTASAAPEDTSVVEVVEEETPAPEEEFTEAKAEETVDTLEPVASPESPAETSGDVATDDLDATPAPPVDAVGEAAPIASSAEVETPEPSIVEPTAELAQPADNDREPDHERPTSFVNRMLLALTEELPTLSLQDMLATMRGSDDGNGAERPDLSFFDRDSAFLGELDSVREEISGSKVFDVTTVGSTVVVSTGLSVGYVVWLARGGVLLASLLSSMPAWRIVDPLPILARVGDGEGIDDGDSLASLIDAGAARGVGPGAPPRSVMVNGMKLPGPVDSLPAQGPPNT